MSMTLILWKAPLVDDADEAQRLLARWYETGDDSAFEQSGALQIVHDELLRNYPMDDDQGADPWADGPDNTGRLLVLSIRWGGDGRILADITALARKFELVLYDPQGPDLFLPNDPLPSDDPMAPPTAWEWFKGFAMAAILCAIAYGAWQIPIWWIKWPAVLVAGFVAAAGLFVVGAMIAGALGIIDVNEGRTGCAPDQPPI